MPISGVLLLGFFSASCVFLTRRHLSRDARIPADVYWGLYTLTVLVGAIIIGLPETRVIWIAYSIPIGIDAQWAPSQYGAKYWFLAFAPYVVPCITILFVEAIGRRVDNRSWIPKPTDPGALVTWIMFFFLAGWGFFQLYNAGHLGSNLLQSGGDYARSIMLRYQLVATVDDYFFRIAYVCLPTICVYALFRAFGPDGLLGWSLLAFASAAAAIFFYLSSFQRAYVIILAIAVGLVLFKTGVIGYLKALVFGAAMFLVLAFLTYLLSGGNQLDLLYTLGNIVFRMPSALPFYEGLFPDVVPFAGLDLGLKFFNIGPAIHPNQLVFNYMSLDTTWVQGASPAPAHYYAYAEGGLLWSIVCLLATGAFIGVTGKISERARSAVSQTLVVFLCIALYYQTQTGFWESIHQSSYGLIWAGIVLVIMSAAESILRLARSGAEVTVRRGWVG